MRSDQGYNARFLSVNAGRADLVTLSCDDLFRGTRPRAIRERVWRSSAAADG